MSSRGVRPDGAAAPGTASCRRRRALRLFTVLAIAGATSIAALLVAEVCVRLLRPQSLIVRRPDVWRPVAGLGWTRSPNLDTEVNYGGAGVVRLVTDADGDRVRASGPVRDPEVRVLAVGDSFLEALQVEHEQSMAALVEDAIADATGRSAAVECAGVGGWNPNQYRLLAAARLAERRYDLLLVFLYTENDVVTDRVDWFPPRDPAPVHHLRWPRAASWDEVRAAVLHPLNDWLELRSHAFILLRRSGERLLARAGLVAKTLPFHVRREDAARDWWDVTADVCAEIAGVARARGVPSVFVLVPPAYLFLDEPLVELGFDPRTMDLEQPHRLVREGLAARGLSIVDLLPPFRAAAARGVACYGEVDSHLTADGHRIAADAVTPPVMAVLGAEDTRHAVR